MSCLLEQIFEIWRLEPFDFRLYFFDNTKDGCLDFSLDASEGERDKESISHRLYVQVPAGGLGSLI